MATLKLWCAVYGDASVFPVLVAPDADVSDLQEAIFLKKRFGERFIITASDLTLYLARSSSDGTWLKNDDETDEFLLRGEIDTQYEELHSTWKLAKDEILGPNFQPGKREIQVLVAVPESAVAGNASRRDALTPMLEKAIRAIGEQCAGGFSEAKKRKTYEHSTVSVTVGKELLHELNIRVETVPVVPFDGAEATPVEPFQWERGVGARGESVDLCEEQQRKRYRAYVEANIGDVLAKNRLCVFGVEKGANILSVCVPGHDINLSGRTDLLILSDTVKDSPSDVQYLTDVKLLIEVKRDVTSGAHFQALSELIALDLLATGRVIALLTDLKNDWHFFWVSSKKTLTHGGVIHKVNIKTPAEAFQIIRTMVAQPASTESDESIRLPCLEQPMKRRKLTEVLPGINEGGGVREAVERYYDVASCLGPDIEMARATARQIVRSIPTFSFEP